MSKIIKKKHTCIFFFKQQTYKIIITRYSMANYHFNLGKNNNKGKYKKIYESILKIAVVFIALLFVGYIGVNITGAFFYSNPEYDKLSDNNDFPKLSKKDANLELYKCRKDLSFSSSDLNKCNLNIGKTESKHLECMNKKQILETQIENEKENYNTCIANENSCKSNLNLCNSGKSIIESNLATCNNLLKEKDIENNKYKTEKEEIIQNYANSVCCILMQLNNPSLRYYKIENNKVVCSEDEGKEFNC